jgi:hypothetical protein
MKNSIKIFFDGSKYMVLDSSGKAWAEGTTIDEAYTALRTQTSEKTLLLKSWWQLPDISLIWLTYRKMIMVVLVLFALIYAQVAVFLSLPSYVCNLSGATYADKVVSITDKVTNALNTMSVADKEKINLSIGRLRVSLCQFPEVMNCTEVTDLKK